MGQGDTLMPPLKRGRRLRFAPTDPPKRVLILIHKRQADWLDARGLNRSSLVRTLLDRYIAHVEADERQKARAR